ncbi:MAG: DUF2071 domain-containing protein, partial [Hymenobacteraceae bacterium]|nr:DUF2071 domain-containing protein [Hymenobacteraceae bacterium]MDX5514155.1 DUF2071 domain-containing protein [Hymenobacteraceae bacterium]
MDLLKRIPIQYKGELHQVKLINFTVEKSEIEPFLPKGIKIRNYKNRALISMVNVKLHHMHPAFLPANFSFNYQHIGFRLLVEDAEFNS